MVPATPAQLRSARRLLQRKERERRRQFLAEGPQAVREALARTGVIVGLFATPEGAAAHPDLIRTAQAARVPTAVVDGGDFATLSGTVTPQGLVAICARPAADLDQVLSSGPRLLVGCAEVRDPGNAGTIIRCADAFGADAVIFSTGSVEVTNPKTVRATTGSLFHLPLVTEVALPVTVAAAQTAGLQVLAADGRGDVELPALAAAGDLAPPTLWLFGNEAWGLSAEHLALVDRVVRVPLYGAAESLNLSTAAAVCLYATATAQRLPGQVPISSMSANAVAPPSDAFLD